MQHHESTSFHHSFSDDNTPWITHLDAPAWCLHIREKMGGGAQKRVKTLPVPQKM
jgi:hypothetical protein